MSLSLDLALAHVETHLNEFSRGYHVGYVRAMAHLPGHRDFTHRLPEHYLQDIHRVLRGTGLDFLVHVYKVEPPGRYGVRFVRIRVEVFDGAAVAA